MLRPLLPHPRGQTWLAMFHSLPYLPSGVGGIVRRGAPLPCPRRPAPPNSLRAAIAGCFCGLLLRGLHAAQGAAGGAPIAPAPFSPLPMGAQARPHAFAGCFGGLLYSRPSMVGPSLAAVRPSGGRTLFRAPLVFRLGVREDYLSSLEYSSDLRGLCAHRRAFA